MRLSSAPQRRSDLFVSAKCSSAIPLCGRLLIEDALVQASLDPAVRTIGFLPAADLPAAQVGAGIIVVDRDDGRFWLNVVAARPARSLCEEQMAVAELASRGLRPIVLTPEEILQEPRFANARQVWSYRERPVGLSLRLQIIGTLEDEGPMKLGHLLAAIRSERDPAPAVLALTCADLIEIDLVSRPLGPATMLRGRSRR